MHNSTANTYISLERELKKHISDLTWAHGFLDHVKYRKNASKRKWNEHEYHVQERKYMSHISLKISRATAKFPSLSFCGPHVKLYGVIGLIRHYHLRLEPKLGHGKCAIRQINFACIACKNMLDKIWAYGVEPTKHPRYQPVTYCTYWTVLGSFDNWNIIKFTNNNKIKRRL